MGAMLAPGLHLGGVGVPVSLRHNGMSIVRIRGSSHPCGSIINVGKNQKLKGTPTCKPGRAGAWA
jgi:hypothetical protein